MIFLCYAVERVYNIQSTSFGKITKIPNSAENSKRRDPYQMAKSKAQTQQTNGYQLSYS